MYNPDKRVSALALAWIVMGLATSAAAAEKFVYLGPKVQSILVNDSAYSGQVLNVGVVGGYQLLGPHGKLKRGHGRGTLAVEGEATVTLLSGSFDYAYACGFVTTCTAEGDWEMNTFGVFAAYRYPSGNIQWKAKGGLQRYSVKTDVDVNVGGVRTKVSGSDTSIDPTVGGGLTMPLGPGDFEVEMMISPRSDTTISIGVNYLFAF